MYSKGLSLPGLSELFAGGRIIGSCRIEYKFGIRGRSELGLICVCVLISGRDLVENEGYVYI